MLEYKGYHADITYDADDNLLVGSVFGIQDSVNFHGSSVSEITRSFHRAVDDYLKLCKETGKDPDKEFRGSLNVRLTPELHRAVALIAFTRKTSLNQVINEAVENYCK